MDRAAHLYPEVLKPGLFSGGRGFRMTRSLFLHWLVGLYDPVRRLPRLDFLDDGFDEGFLLGVVSESEVGAVELGDGLPEAGLEAAQ